MSMRRGLAPATLLGLIVISLPGCSHFPADPGGFLASRGNRYCLQSGALGVAGGAAGGALLGRELADRHDRKAATVVGALLGAVAGGFAGCRYGVWVADQRQDYESEQARLTGELDNSRRTNESLRELNQQLNNDLSARRKELASLRAASASSRLQENQQQQLKTQLNQAHEAAKQQLARAEEELQHHRRTLAALQTQQQLNNQELIKYRQQIVELEQEVAQLKKATQGYGTASDTVAAL